MSIDNYAESIKATKPIREYPIGTKFPSLNGGHWVRVKRGFKWCSGAVFPSVGGDWNGEVILHEQQEQKNERR